MGQSPLLAEWRTCPRCEARLEQEDRSVRCPSCGLRVFANPAVTASALVLDDEGRVLLARRASDPGDGLWDILGGFIDEDEKPLAALRRELAEETSLEIEPLEFLGGYPDRYGEEGIYTLNFYWTARITAGTLQIDEEELAEVAWFAPDELPGEREFAFPNTVEVLRDWKASLGSAQGEK